MASILKKIEWIYSGKTLYEYRVEMKAAKALGRINLVQIKVEHVHKG